MKKLIIYDESCPMCNLYTRGMVASDHSGCLTRTSSGQLTQDLIARLDPKRVRHEIPLVDLEGGETLYGVDTWIYAAGQRNKQLEDILSVGWFKAILQTLYAFISYNRRIIITSAPGRWNLMDLQPDFHAGYRLAFIAVVSGLVGLLFSGIHSSIWPPAAIALILGQLTITCLYLLRQRPDDFGQMMLDYIGHFGMSLLLGGLVIAVGVSIGWTALVYTGYALMIGQHYIRTYRLGLNPWLSVCFTIFVFLLILPQ
ncbi:thiol-disulfide oxidoreductase DCC family protein [Spirosoma fluviale]|uniref:DUF393 domain-containing protein n=1 Tax=Spirosoma fluviale TaxID=1597977 RepID=A0A286GDD6_9BACT|nr:hypothetical protein [Spirosoma fluviale]SOD93256.1 hypothetical protein SAMN06269250_4432 [Spirosoma fluviale]